MFDFNYEKSDQNLDRVSDLDFVQPLIWRSESRSICGEVGQSRTKEPPAIDNSPEVGQLRVILISSSFLNSTVNKRTKSSFETHTQANQIQMSNELHPNITPRRRPATPTPEHIEFPDPPRLYRERRHAIMPRKARRSSISPSNYGAELANNTAAVIAARSEPVVLGDVSDVLDLSLESLDSTFNASFDATTDIIKANDCVLPLEPMDVDSDCETVFYDALNEAIDLDESL
jgi:hypothetical protein